MKDKDEHFWIEDVINRLPSELVPDKRDWSSVLTALTKLKTERNNAVVERNELAAQVERLRGAWESVKATDWDEPIEEVLAETPAQSLEAVKREAQLSALDRFYNHLQGMALSNGWDTESDAYHVSEELKDWCRDFGNKP